MGPFRLGPPNLLERIIMARIRPRQRKSGTRYTAEIRIKRKGEIVHTESRTFTKKRDAQLWAANREAELDRPGALEKLKHRSQTVGDMIRWYLAEFPGMGRSKHYNLNLLCKKEIADVPVLEMSSGHIIAHVKNRAATGCMPQTCLQDIVWLRVVLTAARASLGITVDLQAIQDAELLLSSEGLVGKSTPRNRRPTGDELLMLSRYFKSKQRRRRGVYPMFDIMWFAIYSCRRQREITELRRSDNNDAKMTGLVRGLKNPDGRHDINERFKYTRVAWKIAQRQPRINDHIFPYSSRVISANFTRACKFLGIKNLHFHDLRHEGVTRLFEAGYSIQEVQMFSLHAEWATLQRYTHMNPEKLELK